MRNTIADSVTNGKYEDEDDIKVVVKQKLMTCEEVYLYKVPPLKGSGGHRAEDWDLSKPLQTCSLLVERRDDCLYVDFLDKVRRDPITQQPTLYASSCIDLSAQSKNRNVLNYVEQVADSSRYYTIKIISGERSALIGFGFRERDDSVDFKEAMQFYQNSIRRQELAMLDDADNPVSTDDTIDGGTCTSKLAAKYVVPKLQEGEKIHINTKKKSFETTSTTTTKKTNVSGSLLLRKPPPSSDQMHQAQLATTTSPLSPNVADSTRTIDVAFAEHGLHTSTFSENLDNEKERMQLPQDLEIDDEEWSDFQ